MVLPSERTPLPQSELVGSAVKPSQGRAISIHGFVDGLPMKRVLAR